MSVLLINLDVAHVLWKCVGYKWYI